MMRRLFPLFILSATAATLSASSPAFTPWTYQGTAAAQQMGQAVASVGDVNGDGYGDFIVGAPGYQSGGKTLGAALLFLGSANGPGMTPHKTLLGQTLGSSGEFGYCVAAVGNVNGDAYADFLIGDPAYATAGSAGHDDATTRFAGADDAFLADGDDQTDLPIGGSVPGAVHLYLGAASGNIAAPHATVTGVDGSRFGAAIASLGDFSGDGRIDIAIGAPRERQGMAYILKGSATPYFSMASALKIGPTSASLFGSSLAAADINGDGLKDLVIGAPSGGSGGGVYAASGASAFSTPPSWSSFDDQPVSGYGSCVTAGDVNGDGIADVAVVLPATPTRRSELRVYAGGSTGLSADPITRQTLAPGREFAHTSISCTGDLNGDGFGDIAVLSAGSADEVLVYTGSPDGPAPIAGWTLPSPATNSQFGCSLVGPLDIDNDGIRDLLIGARTFNTRGAAFAYRGTPFGAPDAPAAPAQFTSAGHRLILPGGATAQDRFDIESVVSSPVGNRVKLEVELRETTVAFTGTPTLTGSLQVDGSTGSVTATGLVVGLSYHWQIRSADVAGLKSAWSSDVGISRRSNVAPGVTPAGQSDQGTVIAIGGQVYGSEVVFTADLDDSDGDDSRLEIEAQPLGTLFSGQPTSASEFAAGAQRHGVRIPVLPDVAYHWQFRSADFWMDASAWTSFGANDESTADFIVAGGSNGVSSCAQSTGVRGGILPALAVLALLVLIAGRAGNP